MQKLDFTENIKQLKGLLKSEEIVDFIDKIPLGQQINTNLLTHAGLRMF